MFLKLVTLAEGVSAGLFLAVGKEQRRMFGTRLDKIIFNASHA